MDKLKTMKDTLASCVQAQICGGLKEVDAEELGEAVEMIKNLEEAIYYCTITKAMNESEENGHMKHHEQQHMYYPYYRDMDRGAGKMYYPMPIDYNRYGFRMEEPHYPHEYMYYNGSGGSSSSSGNGSSGSGGSSSSSGGGRSGYGTNYPMELRDYREGRSPMSRRSYMESKEMNKDSKVKVQELEKYMQELTQDVVEMIEGATPEEKQVLQQKLNLLSSKIK